MLILAFDTTSELGGVGIFQDTSRLAWIPNQGLMKEYSITLFEMVEKALAQARLELRQMDLYAVANGPGSFTGIRVGLAAAQAWGEAFGRPVRGVSTLDAMVGKVRLTTEWAFPIMDARRGEFYLGSFRRKPGEAPNTTDQCFEQADEGWVLKPDLLRNLLEERLSAGANAACLVRAHDQAAANLRETLPGSIVWQQVEGALVDSIAAIALKEERSSCPRPNAKLDAYYIRRTDAEINRKE